MFIVNDGDDVEERFHNDNVSLCLAWWWDRDEFVVADNVVNGKKLFCRTF